MPYLYKTPKKPRKPRTPVNRVEIQREEEILSRMVEGWEASDIEERFYRALKKSSRVLSVSFREHYFGPTRTTPGAIELDFMVFDGTWRPIQLDGEYAHKTAAQKDVDMQKDARLNALLMKYGYEPVERIPGDELETQEMSDALVEEMF